MKTNLTKTITEKFIFIFVNFIFSYSLNYLLDDWIFFCWPCIGSPFGRLLVKYAGFFSLCIFLVVVVVSFPRIFFCNNVSWWPCETLWFLHAARRQRSNQDELAPYGQTTIYIFSQKLPLSFLANKNSVIGKRKLNLSSDMFLSSLFSLSHRRTRISMILLVIMGNDGCRRRHSCCCCCCYFFSVTIQNVSIVWN